MTASENPRAPHNQSFNNKDKIKIMHNKKKNSWYRKGIKTNNVKV